MKRVMGLLALACWPLGQVFAAQAYFSSDENVERPIVEAIDRAQQSVQAALFEINSPALADALRRAAARGVNVQILLARGGRLPGARQSTWTPWEIRWIGGRSRRGVMHHKFAIFDGQLMETGSYNWTVGARHSNYENALFEDDADVVRAYMQQFLRLWSRGRSSDDVPERQPATRFYHPRRHRSRTWAEASPDEIL